MSYSEVKIALGEVRSQQLDVSQRWIEHLRRDKKPTQTWACTFCKDRRIFPSRAVLWEHAQAYHQQCQGDHLPLLEEEKEAEKLLHQWQYLRFLELLLLRLLQFLINCSRFGGFPNRRRPKCTTMPWAIWPSLMVLWGVCWMFVVPWSDANHLDAYLEDYSGEEQAWSFSQDFYVNPALIPLPTDYDQFLNNFGSEVEPNNMLHTHYAIHNGAYHDLPADPFEQGLLVPIPSMEDGGFSADAGPDLEYSANDRNQLEKSGQAMVSDPIGNSRTRIPSPNQQEGSDTNNHHLTSPPPAAVIHSSSTPQFAEQLSRGSIIAPEQPESPRNAEGHYICVGFGCSNEKTFRIRSDWQTHVNQHTRPYICSVEGCPYRSATKGVLVRHKLLKHSLRRSASSDLFGVSGTDTSSGPGREPALTSAHGTPAVIYKGKGKAKRKFTDDEDEEKSNNDRNEQGSGSRMVQKTAKRTGCGSTQREEELAQENEKLRQELKKAHEELVYYRAERDEEKKERKTLQGIFDRVTKQMT